MSKAKAMSPAFERPLFDRFAHIANAYPHHIALIFKEERITYSSLLVRVNDKANALQATWGLASQARIHYVGLNDP